MSAEVLIAGGGIGGLSAAIAATRAGWSARLFEQAATFSEAGAGIQLGPNATRILREWGLLEGALAEGVARPARLVVRDAVDGAELGTLRLQDFEARYGAPYLTAHRADLHAALRDAASSAGVRLHAGKAVVAAIDAGPVVRVSFGSDVGADNADVEGEAFVAADGLWSRFSAAPRFTGHLAYRALIERPADSVTAWLGPKMHLVTYPVRGGRYLNVVCLVEGAMPAGNARHWDHAGVREQLLTALGPVCPGVREVLESVAHWRLWALHERAPLSGAQAMAHGRIALLGDAAHPMLPYLAQGAGMAIEDARELERVLAVADGRVLDVPTALQRYALSRWQRCARVQARSARNAKIFHASGPLRFARNVSMRLAGERLLDVPWLYGQ